MFYCTIWAHSTVWLLFFFMIKKESEESKFEINDLHKQLLYLETYSRRENVKFFGTDEVVPTSEVDFPPKDTRD